MNTKKSDFCDDVCLGQLFLIALGPCLLDGEQKLQKKRFLIMVQYEIYIVCCCTIMSSGSMGLGLKLTYNSVINILPLPALHFLNMGRRPT